MSEFTIANELARITLLSSIDFEKELQGFIDSPHLFRLLADLVTSDLSDAQKQLAAIGINYLITRRLNQDYNEWKHLWRDFLEHLLLNPRMDKLEWRFLIITGKGLYKLMEEFQGDFCDIINPIFIYLNYKSKALIYDTFLYVETTPETKYVFVRETIQYFLAHTIDFISSYHDSHQYSKDSAKLETQVIHNLAALLKYLSDYSEGSIYHMAIKISLNVELFLIIVEELLFDPNNRLHQSVLKKDFAPQRMIEWILISDNQDINALKAKIIKIYCTLLCQYDLKSGIEEFDQFKFLYFMENLTPMVIDKLIQLAENPRKYIDNEDIIISMLNFLERSCKFNFMLQTFEGNFEKIFYRICIPFLETTEEEKEFYETQFSQFIRISEELYEAHENQTESIKNSAGKFCQELSCIMHGSLLFIAQNSIQTIRSILLKEQFPQITQAVDKYCYRPSIDTAFNLLSLFSSHYLERNDIYSLIKTGLLSMNEIFDVRGIEKARLIIFLAYNYENLYKDEPNEGSKFLLFADEELNHKNCNSQCSLMLFENCLEVGFGDDIWQNFILRIEKTDIISIFHLLNIILEEMLHSLPVQKVEELISKVIQRLVEEFRFCQKKSKKTAIQGNQFLYVCLDIIGTIVNDEQYLKEEESVISFIWPIFDLFEFAERIQFEDNILKIFNQILAVEKHLAHRHFVFLPAFSKIYAKYNGLMDLVETVTHLLKKSRDYILTEKEGRRDLLSLMDFIKCTYGMLKNEDTLKYILVFFHKTYQEYSEVVPFDEPFYRKLLEIYEIQKDAMKDQTKDAIINFLLVSRCVYGHCDLSIIDKNHIQIFKGYQAKVFIFGLKNIIEKEYESQSLLKYLQYSIRLAHFIRETNLKQQPQRHGYFEPDFPDLCKIDPFNEISLSLKFVKRILEPKRYDTILQQLNKEICLGEIKDLLSRRMVNNSIRSIKKPLVP